MNDCRIERCAIEGAPLIVADMIVNSMLQQGPQIQRSYSDAAQPLKIGQQKSVISLFSIGLVAIIIGITAGCLWNSFLDSMVLQQLVLSPSSKSFSQWKKTPVPAYLKIYLFNWTNPEDFYVGSAVKPNFVEMGPYVFTQVEYKVNEVWNDKNGTITFQRRKLYHFVEKMSNGSLNDRVTNLNTILASIAYMVRYKSKFVRWTISNGLNLVGEKLTVTKTVNELLFEGYDDGFLSIASTLQMFNIKLSPFDKFGWFYQRNGTDDLDGTFNMLTGSQNIEDLGEIKEWNYSNTSKYYHDSCGMIGGSLGDLLPPLRGKKTVNIFIPDAGRSVNVVYNNTAEYLGLKGHKYVSTKDTLDNGTNVPSMACYCRDVECVPSGTFNLSQRQYGSPSFLSLPHFYLADESYRTAINGMRPRKEDHEFSVVVEPTIGVPMQINAPMQINFMVQPDTHMEIFKNVPRTFIPMIWFAQEGNMSLFLANEVSLGLILPMLGHVTFFGIAGIGFLLVSIGADRYMRRRRQADDGPSLILKSENTAALRSDG